MILSKEPQVSINNLKQLPETTQVPESTQIQDERLTIKKLLRVDLPDQ